jgi:hypothetical protein
MLPIKHAPNFSVPSKSPIPLNVCYSEEKSDWKRLRVSHEYRCKDIVNIIINMMIMMMVMIMTTTTWVFHSWSIFQSKY